MTKNIEQRYKDFVTNNFISYDSDNGKTIIHDKYFFNNKGEKEIEV